MLFSPLFFFLFIFMNLWWDISHWNPPYALCSGLFLCVICTHDDIINNLKPQLNWIGKPIFSIKSFFFLFSFCFVAFVVGSKETKRENVWISNGNSFGIKIIWSLFTLYNDLLCFMWFEFRMHVLQSELFRLVWFFWIKIRMRFNQVNAKMAMEGWVRANGWWIEMIETFDWSWC